MKNKIKPGEVYVRKRGSMDYAHIIHEIHPNGEFNFRDTLLDDLRLTNLKMTQEEYLEKHELIDPKRLEELMNTISEKKKIASSISDLLVAYSKTISNQ